MVKIKVPKSLRVVAYSYEVQAIKNLTSDHRLLGQSLCDKEIIKYDPDAKYRIKCVTFWHEVIHGICDVLRMDYKEEDVDRIAQGLVAVFLNDMGMEFDFSDIEQEIK